MQTNLGITAARILRQLEALENLWPHRIVGFNSSHATRLAEAVLSLESRFTKKLLQLCGYGAHFGEKS